MTNSFFKVDTELFLRIAFRPFQSCTSQKKLNVRVILMQLSCYLIAISANAGCKDLVVFVFVFLNL